MQGDKRQPKRRKKKLHDLSDVTSVGITARGALDEYRFNMFMRDFLAEKCKDIFRCKGVLSIHVSLGSHVGEAGLGAVNGEKKQGVPLRLLGLFATCQHHQLMDSMP